MKILEELAKAAGGVINTRKASRFPGGEVQVSSGQAVKLWREKNSRGEMVLRGVLYCRLNGFKDGVPVHMKSVEQAVDTLHNIAQGDVYMRGLPINQFCLHGELKVSVQHDNLLMIANDRLRLQPIVQSIHPSVDQYGGAKLQGTSGVISAKDLARHSVQIHYLGRKIETVSLGAERRIMFLGAEFINEEDFLFGTLEDLRKGPIMRPESTQIALPKITPHNALAVFRAVYFIYSEHCLYYNKQINILFPERLDTEGWEDFMPLENRGAVEMI